MAEKKLKKSEILIQAVKDIAAQYSIKMTLRQIYYRLVATQVIENKISQYKYLSKILVEARKAGKIPYNLMEDRTRNVHSDTSFYYENWKDAVNSKIRGIKSAPYISQGSNTLQKEITIIVLEKEALAGIFKDALGRHSYLVVCRGYNSLTQIKELKEKLEYEESYYKKSKHVYFFSDYDPSGMDIQRNFLQQCEDLGIEFDSFERVALNKEQIQHYDLPYAPAKKTDSRAKTNGEIKSEWADGVVEIDALEPDVLMNMIKKCCKKHFNRELSRRIDKVARIQNRRAKKLYAKKLMVLAEDLMNGNEEFDE